MEDIYPLTVTLTKKEVIMRKVKLIVHETGDKGTVLCIEKLMG